MDLKKSFRSISGYEPYDFQLECAEELSQGHSLVLTAPTGSGKSEVAFVPFVLSKNENLPSQMVYSLPTRTLIDNLAHRAAKYAAFKNYRAAMHHGKRVESPLFEEDIIVTTIDQTVGANVCTPLSAPLRRGNIFAGGASSAFLVFDEIHTFDPDRGLQTAITLIEHASKLKMPVCVMSATLPKVLVDKIQNKIIKPNYDNVLKKEVEDESEVKSRKSREVLLRCKLAETDRITPEAVIKEYGSLNACNRKLIVICNTVDKAQTLFKDLHKNYDLGALREEISDAKVILVHSRFLDEDRNRVEELISDLFSKERKENVILVSTQVVEVGINISSDKIITEIAPIDSLIQRAGRCARWGGKGEFIVYNTEDYGPYRTKEIKQIIDNTNKELLKNNGEILTWNLERELVDRILTDYYTSILSDSKRYEIIGTLARAAYEGNKGLAEKTVRETYACGVSIHKNPRDLGDNLIKLEKINLNVWVFQSKVKKLLEMGVDIWKIEENTIIDDYAVNYQPSRVSDASEILPFQSYIVSPEGAKYDSQVGLKLLEKGGHQFNKVQEKTVEENLKEFYTKRESWVEHATKTLESLDSYFLPKHDFMLEKFSLAFDTKKDELVDYIRTAVALHDLGKLNIHWQKRVGGDCKEPLAHSNNTNLNKVGIPHATVSAIALSRVFAGLGKDMGVPFYLAVAHHHSLRAKEYRSYELVDGWEERVMEVLPKENFHRDIIASSKNGELELPFIDISQEENVIPYKFYCFVSKLLRLSDWTATKGEIDAVLYG